MQQAPYFSNANLPEIALGKYAAFRPKRRTVKFWLISLVLHSITIALIYKFGAIPTKPLQQTPPLNSYLFMPLKPPIEAEIDEIDIADEPTPLLKTDVPIQTKQALDLKTPAKQTDVLPQSTTEQEPNKPVVLTNQNNREVSRIFNSKDIQTSERVKYALMQQMDIAATQALIKQASKDHQKAKLSPNINTVTSVNTWALPEVDPKTEVDCTSTSKQVMAVMSGLLHGTLHCRDNSNFQKYIDQHLNKKQ